MPTVRLEEYAQALFAFWRYFRLGGEELGREGGLRDVQTFARSVRNVRRQLV